MLRSALRPAAVLALLLIGSVASGQSQDRPVRVGGDVREPKRVRTVPPDYPDNAESGQSILELTVDPEGVVRSARVRREVRNATPEAVKAVLQWRYEPLAVKGERVWFTIVVLVPSPWRTS